ncbi:hypothetical protein [Actinomadura kijaniata]|uniref:hypothetical protein n=1 Tax=Actinomadura kijaniata TaxID=46161 RepID=UPI000831D015|nr:hypothetical protein [Actinomadura kijaniata]
MSHGYDTHRYPAEPGAAVARPSSLDTAFVLMLLGAGITLVGALFTLVVGVGIGMALASPSGDPDTSGFAVDMGIGVGIVILIAVVQVGLWLWMAFANRAGRPYARVVSAVLFGIYSLLVLLHVATVLMAPGASLSIALYSLGLVLSLVIWGVGLGATLLLWRSDVSAYIAARSGHPGPSFQDQ